MEFVVPVCCFLAAQQQLFVLFLLDLLVRVSLGIVLPLPDFKALGRRGTERRRDGHVKQVVLAAAVLPVRRNI